MERRLININARRLPQAALISCQLRIQLLPHLSNDQSTDSIKLVSELFNLGSRRSGYYPRPRIDSRRLITKSEKEAPGSAEGRHLLIAKREAVASARFLSTIDENYTWTLVEALSALGEQQGILELYQDACDSLLEALTLGGTYYRSRYDDPFVKKEFLHIFWECGLCFEALGRHSVACAMFAEASSIARLLSTRSDAEGATMEKMLEDVLWSYVGCLTSSGDLEKAAVVRSEAEAIRDKRRKEEQERAEAERRRYYGGGGFSYASGPSFPSFSSPSFSSCTVT
jgi:hypothetical protein